MELSCRGIEVAVGVYWAAGVCWSDVRCVQEKAKKEIAAGGQRLVFGIRVGSDKALLLSGFGRPGRCGGWRYEGA